MMRRVRLSPEANASADLLPRAIDLAHPFDCVAGLHWTGRLLQRVAHGNRIECLLGKAREKRVGRVRSHSGN